MEGGHAHRTTDCIAQPPFVKRSNRPSGRRLTLSDPGIRPERGPPRLLKHVRIPAAYPYLFTAFKVSATASIVGAIVGELPSGFREGLGGSILLGMQYYTLSPADLWATVIVAAALGMLAFLVVVIAERLTLRHQRPVETRAA
jgi:hypothetical protein